MDFGQLVIIVCLIVLLVVLIRRSRFVNFGRHTDQPGSNMLKSVLSVLIILAFVIGLPLLVRAYVLQPYEIPSGSMENTIMPGDMVFAEKVSYYFRNPEPGDIVTFKDPEIPSRTLIKRCIATEGQTVNIDDTGVVWVDGEPLSEPYTSGKPSYPLSGGVSFPYTIPQGFIWVMGDNRTNSQDSRAFGAVAVSSVTGRGALIYWPFKDFGLLE